MEEQENQAVVAAFAVEIARANQGQLLIRPAAAARVVGLSHTPSGNSTKAVEALHSLGIETVRVGRRHKVRVIDLARWCTGNGNNVAPTLRARGRGRPRLAKADP